MLLNNFLEASARRTPDKTALIAGGVRYTYAEIDSLSSKAASVLASEGLEKGDRAVVFLDNSIEAVVGIFGILKAGGVFLPLNPTAKAEKLAYILNNSRACAIISSADKADIIREASESSPHLKQVIIARSQDTGRLGIRKRAYSLDEVFKSGGAAVPLRRVIDADLASVIYTSGSTGSPKGVMLTHLNMVSAANSITEYLENKEDDIILNTLPLSFDYGLYQVLMAFKTGATVILEKAFLYPAKIIKTMLDEKVTGFPIVPAISAILLQMEDIKNYDFEALRYITNTAAALPAAHIFKLRGFFPKARIYSMYGLTECKRVSYLPPEELSRRPASVGKGMPNTEVYIVDENGNRVAPGVCGELVVRGSNIMKGYWDAPEDTAKMLKPGKFPGDTVLYTGDVFKMDEDGYLYFVARKDDIIKSRGEKVSPKEVENVLYHMEAVAEAAVIGVSDDILGQAIKAFVVLKEGFNLTEKDILQHCAGHLENFMVPKHVEFVKEMPKTDTGKIRKKVLTDVHGHL